MKKKFKDLEKKQLLRKLSQFSSFPSDAKPPEGWIRTIRKTLGMTTVQLAKRLNVQQARISEIEKSEIQNQLTLKTLMHVSQALGCRFEYVFVPERPLDVLLKERALTLAREKVEYVSHHMSLENQSLSEAEKEEEIKKLAEELLDTPQKLWD